MSKLKNSGWLFCLLAIAVFALPALSQENRGKTELNSPGGKIVIDYGRPQLKGRDPMTWQADGTYWRMGMNEMTTITAPMDLMCGATKIGKGTYGLWLLKVSPDHYELVFNSDVSGMGMNHDKGKDVGSVPMKKEAASSVVETFTLELKGDSNGGALILTWGTTRLSSNFQFGK